MVGIMNLGINNSMLIPYIYSMVTGCWVTSTQLLCTRKSCNLLTFTLCPLLFQMGHLVNTGVVITPTGLSIGQKVPSTSQRILMLSSVPMCSTPLLPWLEIDCHLMSGMTRAQNGWLACKILTMFFTYSANMNVATLHFDNAPIM